MDSCTPHASCAHPRVDYDTIADVYDEPNRDHAADPDLVAFLAERPGLLDHGLSVLDVGCGTGKQLAADHERWPAVRLVGVDRSAGMLRLARRRCPAASWLRADGASLPLATGAVDYATSQFSYQHIQRTPSLLAEAFRVLRPGGRFVMTNIDPWSMPGWLVYVYFPESWAMDQRDFLPADAFVGLMRDVGFRDVRVSRRDLSRSERLADFREGVTGRHRMSQLIGIPDAAYAAGLRRLHDATAGPHGSAALARSGFVLITIAGDRPA